MIKCRYANTLFKSPLTERFRGGHCRLGVPGEAQTSLRTSIAPHATSCDWATMRVHVCEKYCIKLLSGCMCKVYLEHT